MVLKIENAKLMKRISLLVVFSLLIGISACRKKDGRLSENEMVNLIADIEVAEQYIQGNMPNSYENSFRDRAMNDVLRNRGVTKAEFDSTMTWYGKNIDEYSNLLGKVEQELARRSRSVSSSNSEENRNDYWPYSRYCAYDYHSATNGIRFSTQVKDLPKGGRVNWKIHFNRSVDGQGILGVVYEDGSTNYGTNQLYSSNGFDMTLQSDSSKIVKKIFGSLILEKNGSGRILADSISLVGLPMDTTKFYEFYSSRRYFKPRRISKKIVIEDSLKVSSDGIEKEKAIPDKHKVDVNIRNGRLLDPKFINR